MINFKKYIQYLNRNKSLKAKRYINLYRTIFKNKCKRILEIGTHNGVNAWEMIRTASIHYPIREVEYFGFDLFELLTNKTLKDESSIKPSLSFSEVQSRLKKTGAKVTLFQGDTKDTLPKAKDKLGKMDFIFIDGGHSIKTISSDWSCVKNLLSERTIVIFDDYYTNPSPEVTGIGCQNIIHTLNKNLYDIQILSPMDTFPREWGKLEINFVKVTSKSRKQSWDFILNILIGIEPALLKFFSAIAFLKQLLTLPKIKKAIKNPRQILPYFLQLVESYKKNRLEIKQNQIKRIEENGEVFYKYRGDLYPAYLNRGNARRFIADKAEQYCQGKGIDIGAGNWPLSGVIPIQNEEHQNAYKLDNFADGSLDFVFSSHCLEHLNKWQNALKLWIRKLRINGILFLYLPHKSMRLWNPGSPWGNKHKWIPSYEIVNQFLIGHGMKIVDYNPEKDKYWSFHIIAKKIK